MEFQTNYLPKAGDKNTLKLGFESFDLALSKDQDAKTSEFFHNYTQNNQIMAVLTCIFGNSPYLTHSILVDIQFFHRILTEKSVNLYEESLERLKNYEDTSRDALYKFLRDEKRKIALLVAIADLTREWALDEVTEKLSIFAEVAVRRTCEILMLEAHSHKIINLPNTEKPLDGTGLIVLALGKMGAHELNYSSDIDITIFYEEEKLEYSGRNSISQFYIKLAQELTDILSKRTKDGYVFRVDLRLRPDPASNAVAVGISKAENYYTTVGQNWERAAFIKCNFIAGDIESSWKFLNFMEGHVYRRELDFETIEDIHSIKRQIDTKQGLKEGEEHNNDFYGYNVKIGRGGIREIEFYVQTQQLIWGGRRTRLKEKRTLTALALLVKEKEITKEAARELTDAYIFLRELEHRLQMVDDAQTHTLPKTEEEMLKIAIFCGFDDIKLFFNTLGVHVDNVRKNYITLFEESPSLASDLPSAEGSLIFTGTENHPDTLETLSRMGFKDPEFISETIRGWHHGRIQATTRKKARAELTRLIPSLLSHFANSYNSEEGFGNFHDFLSHQPEDSTIFALLYQNPKLMELITELMSGYPHLADDLANNPALLYYVITPEFDENQPNIEELELSLKGEVSRASNFEEAIDEVKEWAHDRIFRIGIKLIKRELNTAQVFNALSEIAEVALMEIVGLSIFQVESKIREEKGSVPYLGKFAVIAFGKLGNKELTFGSDLDLVFVYDVNEEAEKNLDELNISAQQYYGRIANKVVSAVTSYSNQGQLYNLDLRLRPNGDSGPMASSFASLDNYYNRDVPGGAWVWEYMALTRARALFTRGNEELGIKLQNMFTEKLTYKWEGETLKNDVLHIHKKLREAKRTNDTFHVKHAVGGLVDLEYILQYLQLKHSHEKPQILQGKLEKNLAELGENNIISREDEVFLTEALKLYQKLQNILRITSEKDVSGSTGRIVCKFGGFTNIDELKEKLISTQNGVKALFIKYIGEENGS